MSIIIEPDFIAGKNHITKSCTWYYRINKEHILEIYRDRNYTLGKSYSDNSFTEENEKILKSIREMEIFQKKLDKKLFILKAICKSSNKEILNKRRKEIELDEDNVGKFEFILIK